MRPVVSVIVAPQPIASAVELPGNRPEIFALVGTMIDAAQATIDGPTGWLGRSLGRQTLELKADAWPSPMALPFPPLIEVTEVAYVDPAGAERTLAPGDLFTLSSLPAARGQFGDVRIRYLAGYDSPPPNAQAAVILMAADMIAAAEAGGGLRSFAVDGAFTKAFNSPELMARVRTQAVENLLQPLRIYA